MTLEELSIIYTADVAPAMEMIFALVDTVKSAGDEADRLAGDFESAGNQAGQGLARGILSARDSVMAAARQVATAAAAALRAALDIHSPSKVTEESGAQFGAGLANGILHSTRVVETAVRGLTGGFSPASAPVMQNVQGTKQGDIHLTIPIEVDGYQLGVAAINGINQVSRLSGKAELSV